MKVLVVIDMQNDFITGPLGTKEAQEILPRAIDKVKTFEGLVIYTRDCHLHDDDFNYFNTQEGRKLPIKHCMAGSDGARIPVELLKALQGRYSLAISKSSFGTIDLPKVIGDWQHDARYRNSKPREIEEITFIGLCTDICVITNVLTLKTHFPEIELTIDASCCAGTSPEMHEMALKVMKQCQINIENWSGNDE